MEKINFNTYKIASKLPLVQLASFFNSNQDAGWKEYIKIQKSEIEYILKYDSSDKAVYLYKYGCITFLNFSQEEIYVFLEYLRKLFIELDNKLFTKFSEIHSMTVSEDNEVIICQDVDIKFRYEKNIDDIVAAVLAKSTELYKIETELTEVLDEAGKFIKYLSKGNLKANTKKVISTIAKCIRFKYRSIESVRLLDRPSEFNRTIESRQIFDIMSDYFELNERYDILSNRMGILDSVTEEYFNFRSKKSERRLLMFEILLLFLFPLMSIISK